MHRLTQSEILALEVSNRKKYAYAPTIDQINGYIKELNLSSLRFEDFFGIAKNTIRQVRMGKRSLPIRYWHIIYEKIKPTYGCGFLYDYEKKAATKLVTRIISNISSQVSNHEEENPFE